MGPIVARLLRMPRMSASARSARSARSFRLWPLAGAALLAAGLAPAPAPAQTTAAPAPQALEPRGGEPAVQRSVVEDEGVRIEELRVRGQLQRIVVQSKLGNARPYEILPATQGRDLSQDRRASGQRVWSVLSF